MSVGVYVCGALFSAFDLWSSLSRPTRGHWSWIDYWFSFKMHMRRNISIPSPKFDMQFFSKVKFKVVSLDQLEVINHELTIGISSKCTWGEIFQSQVQNLTCNFSSKSKLKVTFGHNFITYVTFGHNFITFVTLGIILSLMWLWA